MGYINTLEIKKEFINFLRNSDVLSTSQRGVATKTESFTASGGSESFTLSENNVKNVRTVKLNINTLRYGYDYTFDYSANYNITKVNVLNDLSINDDIVITYDYGNTDKIFTDFPHLPMKLKNSFPRIAFNIYGFHSAIAGVGNVNLVEWRHQINIYSMNELDNEKYFNELRKYIIDNQSSLYNYGYIKPTNRLELGNVMNGENKILVLGLEVESKSNYEIN